MHMLLIRGGLLLTLSVGVAAKPENPWLDFGLMPDGAMHSWNQGKVDQSGEVWLIEERLRYVSPQPVPSREGLVSSTVITQYRVHCRMNLIQAMSVVHLDAAGKEVASSAIAKMQERANPAGDKVRDRLLLSVCTKLGPADSSKGNPR